MFKYRKTQKGEWVVFGPASELNLALEKDQPVAVYKRDRSKADAWIEQAEKVRHVGRPFQVDGEWMAYGYIDEDYRSQRVASIPPASEIGSAASGGFTPTAEQQAVIDGFLSGESMIVQAYAGTGKTTVLVEAARQAPNRRGQYMAFNSSITAEAKRKFSDNVNVCTTHALAYGYTAPEFKDRLKREQRVRMPAQEVARRLKLSPMEFIVVEGTKTLRPSALARMVTSALTEFCKSADPEPEAFHFRHVDALDEGEGADSHANNYALRQALLPSLRALWADTLDPQGWFPYRHDFYLKAFAVRKVVLPVDFVEADESQDLSGVMLSIVWTQIEAGKQVILVGDDFQAINGWNGAINAMRQVDISNVTYLTKSWRFGPKIAEAANRVLVELGAPKPLIGNEAIQDSIGRLDNPHAVLCRTNAGAVTRLLDELKRGNKPMLVGNAKEITDFCRAALDLMSGEGTDHPELSWASTWAEIQRFVCEDDGEDLKLMVDIIDDFGVQTILDAMGQMPSKESEARPIISTAHRQKGREYPTVQLDSGIGRIRKDVGISEDELMLCYVAATRAQHHLDHSAASFFRECR